jgi:hypothetical protein
LGYLPNAHDLLSPPGSQYSTKALGNPKASAGLHTQTTLRRCPPPLFALLN